ncbi:MAG: glycosyltransferase [Isosphaeraceae bacterium]|nr:glycosyltransferase [Isosphaeraceae bacterium]
MPQAPLHVLWVEPHFPGRLGAVADWLVRRRGYRCLFYCHTADPPEHWPPSMARGLNVSVFNVGGIAREPAAPWTRLLERSLCYAYGCWEVLEQNRPKPIDLIVGRSNGLGSTLHAPVYRPAPVVNFFDYYTHTRQYDLADEARAETPPTYFHWRRSACAIELLDLENCDLAWTPTAWQRDLFPAEYRDDFHVLHDGVDTRLFAPRRPGPRTIQGRTIPEGTRVVTFVGRTLERLRGFDRFWSLANHLLRARSDVICVAVGDPTVRRGLDIDFHQRDYPAHLRALEPPYDPERLWLLGSVPRGVVAEVLAASDLHVAPGRRYPVARSLLEAMASGCVVLAPDSEPFREVITDGQNGLLLDPSDAGAWVALAQRVLDDPAAFRPVGVAATELVRNRYAQDVTLPRLVDTFDQLLNA